MLQYPQIDPVAIALGPLKIHWYGLMYLVGFLAAWWLGRRRAHRLGLNADAVETLIFYCAMGVILGGRVGYALFYGFDKLADNPLWLFKVWEGGMSFHGGLTGVLIAALVFARKQNLRFFPTHGFYSATGANWPGGGAPWQLYQPRAPGAGQRRALGHGVPEYGVGATSPVVIVRVCPGRCCAVCGAVVVLTPPSSDGRNVRPVPVALRNFPFCG